MQYMWHIPKLSFVTIRRFSYLIYMIAYNMKRFQIFEFYNTKTAVSGGFCVVDPTGFAPVSLRVDGRILFQKTTSPGPRKNNIKKRKSPQWNGMSLFFDTQI
jgi:hypothetical protein